MDSGTTQILVGVWGSSSSDVFAVGYGGTILHFDGTSWAAMSSGTTQTFYGVGGTSPNDVFAVGLNGTIYHYNGSTWSSMSSGTTQHLYGIWGSSSGDVFAVGTGGTILHYNGSTWNPMSSGTTQGLNGVWGSSENDVFAVGGGGTILHFDGSAWISMSSGTTTFFWDVWGSSSTAFFAVQPYKIFSFDGSNWSTAYSSPKYLYGIGGISDRNVFAVGDGGTILNYDGSTWSVMNSGTTQFLYGVWGNSVGDVFAVGHAGVILHYTTQEEPTPTPTETPTPIPTPTPTNTPTPTLTPIPTPTVRTIQFNLLDSHGGGLEGGSVQYYQAGWKSVPGSTDGNGILIFTPPDELTGNVSFRMTYAYASVQKSQNIDVDPIVVFETVQVDVQLLNSLGAFIDTGSVQYYSGGWRTFGETTGGIVTKELLPLSFSFKMTYGYAFNQITQDVGIQPTVVFQTQPVNVQLIDSAGALITDSTAEVKYYSGGWRDFGITLTGEVTKELLPNSYPFRMTYAHASLDKPQNVVEEPTVVFQTTSVQVRLNDSQRNPLDTGTVKYYSGGWRDFGITIGGQTAKELLPMNYSFKMDYGFASVSKNQDISIDPLVLFQTSLVEVRLQDHVGNPLDTGTVKYYSGGWRDFGITIGGQTAKELLPMNYSFKMDYGFASVSKNQDISIDPLVLFQTSLVEVRLQDHVGNPLDTGTVKYYSGGWRDFGNTVNGIARKELLGLQYPFSMSYAFVSNQITQDINTNPIVVFQTGLVHSESGSAIKYYSGGWRTFYQDMQILSGSLQFGFNDGTPNTVYNLNSGVVNLIH